MKRVSLMLALLVTLAGSRLAVAQAPPDSEKRARELFAVGQYSQALEIYGRLYAETTHPTYLRNIGRCYQNLGEPDKAISSFREYLRQVRSLSADQRAVVEGYIHEMEDLKKRQAAASDTQVSAGKPSTTPAAAPTAARPTSIATATPPKRSTP